MNTVEFYSRQNKKKEIRNFLDRETEQPRGTVKISGWGCWFGIRNPGSASLSGSPSTFNQLVFGPRPAPPLKNFIRIRLSNCRSVRAGRARDL